MRQQLYKAYVYRNLASDLSRIARRAARRVPLSSSYWLHKAGLTRYRPRAQVFGGLSLVVLGGLAGAGLALLFAPKPGASLRTQVKDRARRWMERAQTQVEHIAEARA